MSKIKFSIIGAGNGGQSFAAHLTLLGFPVSLYDVDQAKIKALQELGTIKVSGAVTGVAAPSCITDKMPVAVRGADVIMVVVPTCFNAEVARAMAPYLADGQIVILNPGATGGALEFRNILVQEGCKAQVTLAEAVTLLYACRSPQPGETVIFGIKKQVEVAALPAGQAGRVTDLLNTAIPRFKPLPNVLYSSLSNVNAMCHPAPTILNTGRIECKDSFAYYFEGITPAIAKVVEKLDAERLAVGHALGIPLTSILDWFLASYEVTGKTIYEVIQQNKAYDGIKGPTVLANRYIFEDVPTGLVPLASLGAAMGLAMPVTNSVIELANILLDKDYRLQGRTVEKLGLAGLGPEEIRALVS